jgi:diaminopimelate epimerase
MLPDWQSGRFWPYMPLMTPLSGMPFWKMNGLGNDFVVLDGRGAPLDVTRDAVRRIADRQAGIGCDQLIAMVPSEAADIRMRIWNRDGEEVESCGNASRCVADLILGETREDAMTIETLGGLLRCSRDGSGTITVDMGRPRFRWDEIPLSEPFHDTRAIELQVGPLDRPILHSPSVVNVGNPHCLFFVQDLDSVDLAAVGPMLEYHPLFPERANISLVRVIDAGHLALKVWERGAGLTRACGTAACAAAVAAARKRLAGREVTVTLPGGDLAITWRAEDDHILMRGPVAHEWRGVVPELAIEPRQ